MLAVWPSWPGRWRSRRIRTFGPAYTNTSWVTLIGLGTPVTTAVATPLPFDTWTHLAATGSPELPSLDLVHGLRRFEGIPLKSVLEPLGRVNLRPVTGSASWPTGWGAKL